MGIKHQQAPSTPQPSSSSYTGGGKTISYTAPAKTDHMERPLYRTASPAKMANKITNVREEYSSPSSSHIPVSRIPSSGRQDTYGEAAQQESIGRSARNKLSFSSPQYSSPPSNNTPTSTSTPNTNTNTPYSYATHYNAENSPMWLSSTNYNPKQYEDSLIDTVQNMSLTSPVNRVADGAEEPDGSG